MLKNVAVTIKLLSDPNNIRALLGPFRVALMRVVWLILGVMLGFALVYLPMPMLGIIFTSGDPVHLTSGNKDYWVESTALLYAQGVLSEEETKNNLEKAGYGPTEVQQLADANADSPAIQQALVQVLNIPDQEIADSEQGRVSKNLLGTLFPLCCLVLLFLGGSVVAIVLSMSPIPIGPWRKGAVARDSRTAAFGDKEAARRTALKAAAEQAADVTDETSALGDPEVTFMAAYVIGDDLYDDSFAIEPNGDFAGQCGIGISETIGVGDPKKVTAFEVWVFDQEEIQTLTYVLMSEHAYHDSSLRDKLAPRGEAVMATPDGVFFLDTRKLKIRIKIIDLQYGEGSLPPNSYFDNLTISITVWIKGDGSAANITPPVPQIMQTPLPPPPQQPQQPLPPPPMQQPVAPQQQQPYPPMQPPPQQGQGFPPPQQPYPPMQQPPPPPQQGGIRPLQPPPQQGQGFPPQQPYPPTTGRAPMPPQGNAPLPPPPQPRQAPPSDDPFGDTGQM